MVSRGLGFRNNTRLFPPEYKRHRASGSSLDTMTTIHVPNRPILFKALFLRHRQNCSQLVNLSAFIHRQQEATALKVQKKKKVFFTVTKIVQQNNKLFKSEKEWKSRKISPSNEQRVYFLTL